MDDSGGNCGNANLNSQMNIVPLALRTQMMDRNITLQCVLKCLSEPMSVEQRTIKSAGIGPVRIPPRSEIFSLYDLSFSY